MSNFVDISPFSNPLWVAMEPCIFTWLIPNIFRTTSFRIQRVPMSILAPMKNCSGVYYQGKLNLMRGILIYKTSWLDYGRSYALLYPYKQSFSGERPPGGGGTLIFSYISVRRLWSFFGFKILNFNIFGGYQKN